MSRFNDAFLKSLLVTVAVTLPLAACGPSAPARVSALEPQATGASRATAGELAPIPQNAALPIAQIGARGLVRCAAYDAGAVRCWGSPSTARPHEPQGVTIEAARSIAVSENSVCAVHDGGSVSCVRLDADDPGGEWRPSDVQSLAGVASLTISRDRGCAIHLDGSLSCWGSSVPLGGLGLEAAKPAVVAGVTAAASEERRAGCRRRWSASADRRDAPLLRPGQRRRDLLGRQQVMGRSEAIRLPSRSARAQWSVSRRRQRCTGRGEQRWWSPPTAAFTAPARPSSAHVAKMPRLGT